MKRLWNGGFSQRGFSKTWARAESFRRRIMTTQMNPKQHARTRTVMTIAMTTSPPVLDSESLLVLRAGSSGATSVQTPRPISLLSVVRPEAICETVKNGRKCRKYMAMTLHDKMSSEKCARLDTWLGVAHNKPQRETVNARLKGKVPCTHSSRARLQPHSSVHSFAQVMTPQKSVGSETVGRRVVGAWVVVDDTGAMLVGLPVVGARVTGGPVIGAYVTGLRVGKDDTGLPVAGVLAVGVRVVDSWVVGADVTGALLVGLPVVGAYVIGGPVMGAYVTGLRVGNDDTGLPDAGALVVGTRVVGSWVVGADDTGALLVELPVVGAYVIGGPVMGAYVTGLRVGKDVTGLPVVGVAVAGAMVTGVAVTGLNVVSDRVVGARVVGRPVGCRVGDLVVGRLVGGLVGGLDVGSSVGIAQLNSQEPCQPVPPERLYALYWSVIDPDRAVNGEFHPLDDETSCPSRASVVTVGPS